MEWEEAEVGQDVGAGEVYGDVDVVRGRGEAEGLHESVSLCELSAVAEETEQAAVEVFGQATPCRVTAGAVGAEQEMLAPHEAAAEEGEQSVCVCDEIGCAEPGMSEQLTQAVQRRFLENSFLASVVWGFEDCPAGRPDRFARWQIHFPLALARTAGRALQFLRKRRYMHCSRQHRNFEQRNPVRGIRRGCPAFYWHSDSVQDQRSAWRSIRHSQRKASAQAHPQYSTHQRLPDRIRQSGMCQYSQS